MEEQQQQQHDHAEKHVSWGALRLLEFNVCLGDHPLTFGVPLCLSYNEGIQSDRTYALDFYEDCRSRTRRRNRNELRLCPKKRLEL